MGAGTQEEDNNATRETLLGDGAIVNWTPARDRPGSLSAVVGLFEHLHGGNAVPYFGVAGGFFVLAIVRVCYGLYWEARPYERSTFKNAEAVFISLNDEQRIEL